MASSYNKSRDITFFLSTGHYPKTGVVEVWESQMDLESEKVNWGRLSEEKNNRDIYNNSRDEILYVVKNLNGRQFIRLRDLTTAECLRLMSVPQEYVDSMLNLERELKNKNHTEDESPLRKMAGNSIVVDVLYYIFKSLFINIIHIK